MRETSPNPICFKGPHKNEIDTGRPNSCPITAGNSFSTPTNPAPWAADEDNEEAHAFYHHTHPPGYGG